MKAFVSSLCFIVSLLFFIQCGKEKSPLDTGLNKHQINNQGISLLQEGNFKEALERFDKAVAMDNNFALAYYNQGVCYQALKDLPAATKAYSKAISLKANFPKALFNLALVYSRKKDTTNAVKFYKKFLKVAPPSMQKPIADAKRHIAELSP
ncbi:MAG: tetratricopeptide repeat protein [Spirochaetota bacterium]